MSNEEENNIIRQFQVIDEEMNAFYEDTVEECRRRCGSDRKEFLLQQLQRLKDKVHNIETRALAIYSNQTADEDKVNSTAEIRLKAVQMCCAALIDGFMHEFDLLQQ